MKHLFNLILFTLILLSLNLAAVAEAATITDVATTESFMATSTTMPVITTLPPTSAFGAKQYYSVFFDEEGEASVIAKIIISNPSPVELRKVTLEIPGQVQLVNYVQEIPLSKQNNYYDRYYDNLYDYKTLTYTTNYFSTGSSYTFTLPQPVKEQGQATFLIYYKAAGYAKNELGIHRFLFETFKINQDTDMVHVSVKVSPELYLKGTAGKINYVNNNFYANSLLQSFDSLKTSEMSTISHQIEYDEGYVKEAYHLDPLESFTVAGEYSDSWLWLNHWKILFGLLTATSLFLFSAFVIRKRKIKNRTKPNRSGLLSLQQKETIFWGFISSLGSLLTITTGAWILDHLRNWIGYQWNDLMTLFVVMAMIGAVLALLIVPPIYVGKKYQDYLAGILTISAAISWLIVLSGVTIVIFSWIY